MTSDENRGGPLGWPEAAPWIAAGFEEARRFRILLSLHATAADRLRDLEAMLEFTTRAEEMNPRLRSIAERLRATRTGISR